jgi:hypothetical protein
VVKILLCTPPGIGYNIRCTGLKDNRVGNKLPTLQDSGDIKMAQSRCKEQTLDELTNDLSRVAFFLDADALNELKSLAEQYPISLSKLKTEYLHLRFHMVERAILGFAANDSGREDLVKEFYKKSAFCLIVPEFGAPCFMEAEPNSFWKDQEARNSVYCHVSISRGHPFLVELAEHLIGYCGVDDMFAEAMSLCTRCVAVAVSVGELLKSITITRTV